MDGGGQQVRGIMCAMFRITEFEAKRNKSQFFVWSHFIGMRHFHCYPQKSPQNCNFNIPLYTWYENASYYFQLYFYIKI
uniref:Putative ovule protein n=1 Tax=Solanum chacoense TaxID=4108 RepID=A0A0V0I6G4_SOLCH